MTAREWLDRFFAAYYARRPVNATFIGIHEYDHLLPDFSEAGAGDTLAEMELLLAESAGLENSADPIANLDLQMARGFLRIQIAEYRSDHFHRGNPAWHTGEAVFGVLSLLLVDDAPGPERIEAATARLAAIPRFLNDAARLVRAAPAGWIERARQECAGAIALLTDGTAKLVALGLVGKAFAAAADVARDAFVKFDTHMAGLPAGAHPSVGPQMMALYLSDGHFATESALEVARYAEAELAAADAALEKHPGKDDPDPSGADCQRIWHEAKQFAVSKDLLTWPDFPIRYEQRPVWVESAAPHLYFLFYRAPAAFNRGGVHRYLLPPGDVGQSTAKLNHVVHHGGIGHHVQNWYAYRAASQVGRIAAVDCASRIAMFCGGTMAEGWACYATDLMREAGFLTRREEYDELLTRRRMCARAVVDVRLHTGAFSFDQAVAYYQARTKMPAVAARAETIKNSMFPGTAMMYVLGTDRIHRLRRTLSAREGSAFSLRRFHDRLLSFGSVPVYLIADLMEQHAL